jgi:hypothetical protein
MGVPPLLTGAVKLTLAVVLPGVATTLVGLPGTLNGVTLFEGAEAAPGPAAFVATTVNVYAVPLVRPVTMWVVDVLPVLLSRPPGGLEVTV